MTRPRIRTVKPEMRQDESYGRLTRDARELFNGLITFADDDGRFRALPSMILGHVFPYDDDAPRKLDKWMREVGASGLVVFYEVEGVKYGCIPTWHLHQNIDRYTESRLPTPPAHVEWVPKDEARTRRKRDETSTSDRREVDESSTPPAQAGGSVPSPVPVPSPEVEGLCRALAEKMVANDPKAKVAPDSDRWQTDMRRLIERDGRKPDEILAVIEFSQRSDFWRANILSPAKLRDKFPQLALQRTRDTASVARIHPADAQAEKWRALGAQWAAEDGAA